MKKIIFLFIFCSLIICSCQILKKHKQASNHQKEIPKPYNKPTENYLPNGFEDIWLGMSLVEFSSIYRLNELQPYEGISFRIEYTKTYNTPPYEWVTFYFDRDGSMLLYELIIEFTTPDELIKCMRSKYGEEHNDKEWIYQNPQGFQVRVWSFDKRLVVAAHIKGTEWNE